MNTVTLKYSKALSDVCVLLLGLSLVKKKSSTVVVVVLVL